MASKSIHPFYTLTAEERQKIAMPDRFKCRQCDQFKIPASFSNKEIKDYQFKKICVPGTNGISARLRCRPCAGEQLHELQCEGQCGMRKPLEEFSKSQRTRGLKWCQECILWKEAAEPGILTAAAPGTELAPDEDPDGDGWGYNSDPEIGSDDDDKSDYQYTPWKTMGQMVNGNGKVDTISSAQLSATVSPSSMQPTPYPQITQAGPPERAPSGAGSIITGGYVPPHIRAMNREVMNRETMNSVAMNREPPPGFSRLQPRVENLIDVDAKTESSVSNPYEDTWSSNGTVGPWSAVDTRRRNALYEPQRSLEERIIPTRGPAPFDPAPRSGAWAKPIGVRTPAPQFPQPSTNPRHHRQGYDSDESPDEM